MSQKKTIFDKATAKIGDIFRLVRGERVKIEELALDVDASPDDYHDGAEASVTVVFDEGGEPLTRDDLDAAIESAQVQKDKEHKKPYIAPDKNYPDL